MDINIKIKLDYLIIEDSIKYYGGSQEWYGSVWKRKAGCGPTTATTITMYEQRKNNLSMNLNKQKFIKLMEELWNYVTPRTMGLNKIEYYAEGYDKYITDNNIGLSTNKILKISKLKIQRPSKKEIFEFLKQAIENNHPVAFLNLHHGRETRLESWHWVTIVGITYNIEKDILKATIADDGVLKEIDLGLWEESTTEEGGFIYYY